MSARVSNKFVGVNYLPTTADMPVPPEYWLQRLYDFDADLVVFPSHQVPAAYVLARRARLTGGITAKMPGNDSILPDTKFCIEHHLLPVSLIYRHSSASWSIDNILADLRARDIWAHGGAKKAADLIEARERQEQEKIKTNIRDDFWNRSGDAWRSYQARTGQRTRTHYGHRTAKKAAESQTAL